MPGEFFQTLASRDNVAHALEEAVERWGESLELKSRDVFRLNLVLDELVTNVVRHGYKRSPGGEISVRIALVGDDLLLTLRDHAEAYDPFSSAPPPDLDNPVQTRRVGGLGVHFVKSVARSVRYRRDGDVNEIVVTLPRGRDDDKPR